MATIVAQANGNWSNPATWTGGVVPGAGDIAQTGNYAVTIDASITCTLNPTGSGRFDVTTGGITITGDLVMQSSYTGGGLRCTHTSGEVTLTGTATGGSGGYAYGAYNNAAGTMTVGTATGGAGNSAYGASNNSTGTLNVTTATGSAGSGAYGAHNNGAGTLNVTTATGGAGTYAYGAYNNSTGTLNVTTATGGAGIGANGAYNNGAGTLVCDLAVGGNWGVGGTGAYTHGVYGSGVTGQITKVKRIQFGPYGCAPVGGAVLIEADISNSAQFRTAYGGATLTLTDPSASADWPAEADVRAGVEYDLGDKTGTAHIPAAGSVALGVPVDATTGTAVLTAAAVTAGVWDAARSGHAGAGTFGATSEWAGSVDEAAIATAAAAAILAAADSDPISANVTYSAGVAVSGRLAEVTDLPSEPLDATATQAAAAAALTAYDPPTNAEMVARTLVAASYATATALDAVDNFIDTEVGAIKAVTDKLDTAVELDGAVYRFTTNALEQAPTGGSAPSAADIRAEIDANSTQLAAIVADTNELQTDLVNGGRLDLLIDAIKAKTDNLPSDPADQSAVEAAITSATSGLATAANLATLAGYVDTEVAAILADTDNLPASQAAVGSAVTLTAAYDAAKTAATQTSVDDLPTNAELAAALAAADDAMLAAIADVPTVAEFEARTLPAADYTVVSDLPSAASIADAVWDEAIAGHAGAGSTGAALAAATAPSAASIADAVWDEAIAGHAVAGSTGAALAAAGSAGDPWSTPLPGAYGAGTAGKLLADLPTATEVVAAMDADPPAVNVTHHAGVAVAAADANGNVPVDLKLWRGLRPNDLASSGDIQAFVMEIDNLAQQNVADALLLAPSGAFAAGSAMAQLAGILEDTGTTLPAAIAGISAAGDPWSTALPGAYGAGTAGALLAGILEDTGTTLPAAIAAIEPGGGSYAGDGTGYYSDTIDDGTSPLDGVRVQLYTSPNRVGPAYEAYTNALGVFEMWPDPGVYYRWLDLAGYNFSQDVAVTVTEP